MSNMPEEKEIAIPAWIKTQSSGGLQPTPEMGLDLRVWDLCIDYSRFIKKQINKT